MLSSQSSNDLYLKLVSDWQETTSIVIGEEETPLLSTGDLTALESLDDVQRMMAMDMLTYLPNADKG